MNVANILLTGFANLWKRILLRDNDQFYNKLIINSPSLCLKLIILGSIDKV